MQESLWYIGAASTRVAKPIVNEMENIKNNWLRLIKKIDQQQDSLEV